MLGWVVRRAEASLLDDVVVVVGHDADAIRRHVVLQRARFVVAPDFHEGCTSSIRAGLEVLQPQSEAVVLILGDQPGIESDIIAAVVEGWRHMQSPIVRVSYRGRSGHPMLFAKAQFGQLKASTGTRAYGSSVMRIPSGCTRLRSTTPTLAMSIPGRITPS